MSGDEEERIALVIAAHPDDGDFGCAGYASMLIEQGWRVHWLVCTNGGKGTSDRTMPVERLVALRRDEQREACVRLGLNAGDVHFLEHEDGELVYDRALLEQIVRHIRTIRPFTVFTHDTDQVVRDSFINHPDHRATGAASLDAMYPTARDHLNFPEHIDEGLEPHKVREILLWSTNHPNFEIDISAVVERKIYALSAHETQFGGREDFAEFARDRWRDDEGRYVERYRRIELGFRNRTSSRLPLATLDP
ncbi:MAG: PIG-L deacetylase family protein [Dehalococcoidia bacterium]|nr:PIG-L deacetylase family protein [Dehalococcoidia bacterium]